MKVISIGRNHENTICINDPHVSRHHCQIVQYDNGTFAIVDMNSINGTYVNGNRVCGQVPLKQGDRVRVAQTGLSWQQYFPQNTQKHYRSWLWPMVAATIAMAVLTAVAIIVIKSNSDKAFPFKGVYPEVVAVELVNDKGYPYTIEAIEGQVCVWFNDISVKDARKCIMHLGGEIIAQIPDIGYYLVKVPADDVQNFITVIHDAPEIERAFPNMASYPCMVNTYILDNYYPDMSQEDTTPHGVIVQYALQEYGTKSPLKTYNIGSTNGKYMCMSERMNESCVNNAVFALDSIASSLVDNQPIVINMSFGPYLRPRKNEERYYWDSATDDEKLDYQENFKNHIQDVIKIVKPLEGKDFIVTKSAGNNGVKVFDAAIIAYLENNLIPEEKDVLDKHFLLVTAGEKEDDNKDYSNEMEKGHYHPWVTQVDISDFKYNGRKRRGTSFAAPRSAGFISLVVNKYDLTASEVLKYAREATRLHPQHLLTVEMLDSLINMDKGEKSSGYVDLGLPSGTLWKMQNEEGHYDHDGAVRRFGRHLPTKDQMEELQKQCRWTWTGEGYRVDGPNGKSIMLPVSGYRQYESEEGGVEFTALNETGWYWTSTIDGSGYIWFLKFFSNEVEMSRSDDRSDEFSVRLVIGGTRTANRKPVTQSQSQTDLTGTVWLCENQYEYGYSKTTLEFLSNNRFRVTKYSRDIVGEDTKTYEENYNFRKGKNDWIIGSPDAYRSQAFYIRNDLLIVYDIISGPNGYVKKEYKRVR